MVKCTMTDRCGYWRPRNIKLHVFFHVCKLVSLVTVVASLVGWLFQWYRSARYIVIRFATRSYIYMHNFKMLFLSSSYINKLTLHFCINANNPSDWFWFLSNVGHPWVFRLSLFISAGCWWKTTSLEIITVDDNYQCLNHTNLHVQN